MSLLLYWCVTIIYNAHARTFIIYLTETFLYYFRVHFAIKTIPRSALLKSNLLSPRVQLALASKVSHFRVESKLLSHRMQVTFESKVSHFLKPLKMKRIHGHVRSAADKKRFFLWKAKKTSKKFVRLRKKCNFATENDKLERKWHLRYLHIGGGVAQDCKSRESLSRVDNRT